MAKLGKGLQRFYELMHSHLKGDIVTRDEILAATEWSDVSFVTYLKKNKFASFLEMTPDKRFKILRHGESLTEADVQGALSQVTPQGLTLLKGERLTGTDGTYVLIRQIGQGAVGHVWEVTKEGAKDRFALKVVNPRVDLLEPSILEDIRARFQREAHNGLKLRSDAIIRCIDQGKHRNAPFFTMELAAESVAGILLRGPLSIDATIPIISRCVVGLMCLHGENCIHRDVKPANILKLANGFVLGDLGIVKWSDLNPLFTSAGTLTRASVQLGSWYYMAPEQQNAPYKAVSASDIYALGVTWYELLTGKTPPSPAVFAAQRTPAPCANSQVHQMIGRMTAFEPESRPALTEVSDFIASLTDKPRRK